MAKRFLRPLTERGIKLEQLVTRVLKRSPFAGLVQGVARVRASVHTKLLLAFLIIMIGGALTLLRSA